jgi:phosphonopyruvate decarboxylase
MINLEQYQTCLQELGVEFITGVPDTLLNDFCLHVEQAWPTERHAIAANEGNAIALAAGYHLATGTVPLVYMQNSGLGNATNPLISLTDATVYGFPMVLLIGWRGVPGGADWPQHQRQGELTPTMLEAMNIPHRILSAPEEAETHTRWAVTCARDTQAPTALLVKKGVLARPEKAGFDHLAQVYSLSREEAINALLDILPKESIYVATTGRCTRELHALREQRGESHAHDFLNVGAMGHALSIAAGLAAGYPKGPVVCLDGDGAALMHLGSLAVTAGMAPKNLLHVVLNNGVHESVGGQATRAMALDFERLGQAVGYRKVIPEVATPTAMAEAWAAVGNQGPGLIEIRIRKGMRPDMPLLRFDLQQHKQALMQTLRNTK